VGVNVAGAEVSVGRGVYVDVIEFAVVNEGMEVGVVVGIEAASRFPPQAVK
jgi:hypothetical protein